MILSKINISLSIIPTASFEVKCCTNKFNMVLKLRISYFILIGSDYLGVVEENILMHCMYETRNCKLQVLILKHFYVNFPQLMSKKVNIICQLSNSSNKIAIKVLCK